MKPEIRKKLRRARLEEPSASLDARMEGLLGRRPQCPLHAGRWAMGAAACVALVLAVGVAMNSRDDVPKPLPHQAQRFTVSVEGTSLGFPAMQSPNGTPGAEPATWRVRVRVGDEWVEQTTYVRGGGET